MEEKNEDVYEFRLTRFDSQTRGRRRRIDRCDLPCYPLSGRPCPTDSSPNRPGRPSFEPLNSRRFDSGLHIDCRRFRFRNQRPNTLDDAHHTMMDQIPPYDFHKYTFGARVAVLTCASFELLCVLFGSLDDSHFLSKLVYFLFIAAAVAASGHNLALNVDGREEIKKALQSTENEVRGRSAALVLAPAASGVFVFLCVSGHAFFSLFVLVHVLAAIGQLSIEAYEVRMGSAPAVPITAPADKRAVAESHDPNYQTLANVQDDVFEKKK